MDYKYKKYSFLDQKKIRVVRRMINIVMDNQSSVMYNQNKKVIFIKSQFELKQNKKDFIKKKHFLAIKNLKYFVFDSISRINQQQQVLELLNSGFSDLTVKIFNLTTAFNLQGSSEGSTPTTSIRWRKDCANKVKSIVINVNSDGLIMLWHAQTGKQLHKLVEKNNQLLCMDLDQMEKYLLLLVKIVKSEFIFDSADYNQIGHLNRVFTLKFLEEFPTTLLSCGWDGNLVVLDLRDNRSIGTIQGPQCPRQSIKYIRNGQILTGSYRTNNQLQFWDFGKRSLITNIKWKAADSDNSYIYSCQFSKINDGTILAGSCGKQKVKLFDINDNYKVCGWIRELQEGIYCVDYGNKSNKFAFGCGEGVVYICQLNTYK